MCLPRNGIVHISLERLRGYCSFISLLQHWGHLSFMIQYSSNRSVEAYSHQQEQHLKVFLFTDG